jgi:hypothetical protein
MLKMVLRVDVQIEPKYSDVEICMAWITVPPESDRLPVDCDDEN